MGNDLLHIDDPRRYWGIGEVLKLSIPTSLGMANNVLMQFLDGLMVSHIKPDGAVALSAQTPSGLLAFTAVALLMGTLTVVNTFVSQNLGANRLRRCSQYAWQGLYLALAFSVLITPLALAARPLFALLGHTPEVQALEVVYFQYMILGTWLLLTATVLQQFFYGIQRPGLVYFSSIVANVVNLVVAYVLIFGAWGFPALGLRGAAIGTLAGGAAGLLVLAWFFFVGRSAKQFQTRRNIRLKLPLAKDLLRIGSPAGFQMFIDVFGWSITMAALVGIIRTINGRWDADASTVQLAGSSVAMRYMPLSFMPAVGIGVAATALVGEYIGKRRPDLARRRAYAALFLAVTYMGLCGLAFGLWRYPLVEFFIHPSSAMDPSVRAHLSEMIEIGSKIMICAAVFQLFDAVGIVFISALRGAGDTLWPALAQGTVNLVVLIGGGFAMIRFLPQLEGVGVWMAGSAYVIILGFVMFWRFHSGRWQKIDLLSHVEQASASFECDATN